MKKHIGSLLFWMVQKLLSIRYLVSVQGLENISSARNIIFVSKHPAMVDSLMLFGILWDTYTPQVIIAEKFFSSWALCPFMKIIDASDETGTARRRRISCGA
ncbi:MAG: 1-acyl-sn-glycerol-3-phosphate acyltransferase [Candidatus Lloydbacteria bacterium]|nr:1-acyl-sn-glycerol-3-phosphate acyltransferase [Candidatus Lloydbacteria bacterium]